MLERRPVARPRKRDRCKRGCDPSGYVSKEGRNEVEIKGIVCIETECGVLVLVYGRKAERDAMQCNAITWGLVLLR